MGSMHENTQNVSGTQRNRLHDGFVIPIIPMRPTFLIASTLILAASASHATLSAWQTEVSSVGTTPASSLFSSIPGGSPIIFNVGSLSGDRAFEFIVNSPTGGVSQALIGTQDPANGRQGLKFDQCCNTGVYGMTNFGVIDYNSSTPTDFGRDVHIVFTSDGTTTDMYTDGVFRISYATGLFMTDNQGLGAADNFGSFFDIMAGSILGFASYDSTLSPAEILQHNDAFTSVVPEPSGVLLSGLAALGMIARRRR